MNICPTARKFNCSRQFLIYLAPAGIGKDQLGHQFPIIAVHGLDNPGKAAETFVEQTISCCSFPEGNKCHQHPSLGMGKLESAAVCLIARDRVDIRCEIIMATGIFD